MGNMFVVTSPQQLSIPNEQKLQRFPAPAKTKSLGWHF